LRPGAGDEGDAVAVGAVARRAKVPGGVAQQRRARAAAQVDLGQRDAVEAFSRRRVEGEDDAPAVGRDVEAVGIGVGARSS
jgi:hypothetical protein